VKNKAYFGSIDWPQNWQRKSHRCNCHTLSRWTVKTWWSRKREWNWK